MNMIKQTRPLALVISVTTGFVVSGCATPNNPALSQLHTHVNTLINDPVVAMNAPVALYETKKALRRAESNWRQVEDDQELKHLVYLTQRKAEIAQYTAQRNVNDERLALLHEQRDQIVLQSKQKQIDALVERVMKLQEYKPEKTDRGLVLTLGDVLFATGKANLTSASEANLIKLATYLRDHPDRDILIEGYTDQVGSRTMNKGLSLRRADSIASFLEEAGVDRMRMVTKGYGEQFPQASNATAEGRQYNRRVELVILDPGQSSQDASR